MERILTDEVEEVYSQLVEHFADRFPYEDAVSRATDFFYTYYLR